MRKRRRSSPDTSVTVSGAGEGGAGGTLCQTHGVNTVELVVDTRRVTVPAQGTLLDALREELGLVSAKDGCSPQGQCGCCTVLVDGQPRVACVTPVTRVAGREVTTFDGLDAEVRATWCDALWSTGGTQCGFCTPGIAVRLAGAAAQRGLAALEPDAVASSLLAHLCRCTGWQTIVEAAERVASRPVTSPRRDVEAATRRSEIEGGTPQRVGPEIAAGRGGFAEDLAPRDALVALRDARGDWVVGESLAEARAAAGIVPGRRSSAARRWPLEPPAGSWARILMTTWVEPGYLELDATWCEPGGEPASMLANGGAFGAKTGDELGRVARALADRYGRAVRVRHTREDTLRLGPKRPPLALGLDADGTGVLRVVRTSGVVDAVARWAPGIRVEEIDVSGPPTSLAIRGAVWAELAAAFASFGEAPDSVLSPEGARAEAHVDADRVRILVDAGDPLDEIVLRSYVIGAAHQALGWVRSEGLAVDENGEVQDLTIRSLGILRAVDTPPIEVEMIGSDRAPVAAGPAVFAAVAAAAWRHEGHPERWPVTD